MGLKIRQYPTHTILQKSLLWMTKRTSSIAKEQRTIKILEPKKKGNTMPTVHDTSMMRQIAMLLIQADKLVKEGNLHGALDKIKIARTSDPSHLYAIAYEERVQALMQAHGRNGKSGVSQTIATASSSQPGTGYSVIPEDAPADGRKEQETIVTTAQTEPTNNNKNEPGSLKTDGARQLEKSIASILAQAHHYFLRKEYTHALDEIAKVYLFAPLHEKARALELAVRSAIQTMNSGSAEVQASFNDGQHKTSIPDQSFPADQQPATETQSDHVIKSPQQTSDQWGRTSDVQKKKSADEPPVTVHRHSKPDDINLISSPTLDHKQTLSDCLRRVNELLRMNKLENALSELVPITITDPFNERLLNLEKTIVDAQHRQYEERRKWCNEIADMI